MRSWPTADGATATIGEVDAIGELLEGALPADRPGGALVPVLRAWADAVGPEIARHASPARRTRDGDLVVHTSDAGWAQALTLMADDLVGKLAAALGADAPRALRFQVGTVRSPDGADADGTRRTPQARAAAAALAAPIADERLRAAAQRVDRALPGSPDSA